MKFTFSCLLLLASFAAFSQDNTTVNDTIKEMETELDEVVVEKKKKAVERRADRTIYNFEDQPHLNSGSLQEGLKKIPGLIISEVAGMMYQGKGLEVYMDGRPLNIYSNELTAYLEGMPANSIEKVEIITNPGAEFPATSGGAILNIITSKNAKKFLSATYSNGYSYTNYNGPRHRFNNSLMLSGANNLFSWQLNGGQSYSENYQATRFTNNDVLLSQTEADRLNRFYYIKSGIKLDLGKDRLLVNYDLNTNSNTAYVEAGGVGFATDDKSKTQRYYHDALVTYQKRFTDPMKKLDIRLNYNNNNSDFGMDSRLTNAPVLDNDSDQDFYQLRADYSQEISFMDKTKISAGLLADRLDFEAVSFGIKNLDYTRNSYAAYSELQATYKKFDLTVGGRLESYDIYGKTDTDNIIPFKQTRFFPSGGIQYNIMPQVYARANYNKKISLPNTASLNPNNTSYQNPNVGFFGNPNLEPAIFHNYEVSISAFEYFTIGYSITDANNQIINRIIELNGGAASVSENLNDVKIRNFNIGMPIPLMLFTEGLAETLKFDVSPDELSFLYIYAGNQKHIIPGLDTKGFWSFNFMAQVIMPAKVKLTANYNTSTTGGNYYYYIAEKPFYRQMDLTFTRKFLSDNLSVSVYANDIFNHNRQEYAAVGTNLLYATRADTRRVGFSLNYKIPTKNRMAQESNILNSDKQQEEGLIKN